VADTIFTIEDAARKKLKLGTTAQPGAFLPSAEFAGWALRYALSVAQSYNLTRLASGYWMYQGKLSLFGVAAGVGYTAVADVTYTVYCCGDRDGGPVVLKSGGTGTDPASPFVLTGIPIDFPRMMAALIRHIADTRMDEYAQNVSGGGISPQSAGDQLRKLARDYQGAFGI
jgi:hypothetical protein